MSDFLPSTPEEVKNRGWDYVDIVLVTGDAYIDHPSFGAAVIGRVLEQQGYRVAICDMPDVKDTSSFTLFGAPRLFFAVTGGNVDSVMMRYTSFLKVRNDDPFRPETEIERPLRSLISYCNCIRSLYKGIPIVIGGIEASMRRLAHYDFVDNKIRRSILLDSRADILIYGMGEYAVKEVANRIKKGIAIEGIPGTVIVRKELPDDLKKYKVLPDEETLTAGDTESKKLYGVFFKTIYLSLETVFVQGSGGRFLLQYPPYKMTGDELDTVYELPYKYSPAPKYLNRKIDAFNMIQNSINSHRGCVSGCAFCSIALHQGRRVVSRSEKSIIQEIETLTRDKNFKGHVSDVGGPTANMYAVSCRSNWQCTRESCLYPNRCPSLVVETKKYLKLLEHCRKIPGVKKISIGSGVRYDLFYSDYKEGLEDFIVNYVGGQLKIAPEHTEPEVLHVMRKVPLVPLADFVMFFSKICKKRGVKYFLVPYLMSNHPGSSHASMIRSRDNVKKLFGYVPKQVQSFFPLPLTLSSAVYYTGYDPLTGKKVFVEKDKGARNRQHSLFFEHKKSKK
ncbi:MAG: YgiQ family radical SAM protein [Spirochaetes bacterium]|nr:YgiQ family radical SAM protein [Spirochaetota bacterium]MBN2770920.1 YgiQ family radical SAM protein [Spirochaetota bacterium]